MTRQALNIISKKKSQAYITYFTYTTSLTAIALTILLSFFASLTRKDFTS